MRSVKVSRLMKATWILVEHQSSRGLNGPTAANRLRPLTFGADAQPVGFIVVDETFALWIHPKFSSQ